ncbi:MAG: diguanylate cyclase [Chromatiales bacterium]|nr:diguanylate cyclase [Chromatiales bacterium]
MAESRIMVVDSSAVSREIVARILRNVIEGANVITCGSGAEALQVLAENPYNLVTTSLLLSDMDGLDFCRQLRGSKDHHSTPLIVISGDADERLLKEGFSAGVTDYFDKSRGYPAFGAFIKRFCQRNSGLVGSILYIEDSKTAAAMTIPIMERHGLKLIHVLTAEEGLELVKQMRSGQGESFDIVVTDFYLKGEMTGGDLLHALRTRLHFSQQELPVLMITGNDDLRTQVEAFHAGANDFVAKPLVEEVLMARLGSLLMIKHQYDALERQAQSMERVATTDSLTGARNRHYMGEHGEKMLAAAEGRNFWSLIVDIDHFKKINDTQGHLVGDHVLAAMGALLKEQFTDDVVVRFGGEEFVVLLSGLSRKEVMGRAEELRCAVESLKPEDVAVTISVGIAGIDDHKGCDLNELLGLADKALYVAKDNGRNQVCLTQSDGTVGSVTEHLASA